MSSHMRTQEYRMEYASARATTKLVGRGEILDVVQNAIEAKSKLTQVIYVTAKGGMGKTRLLEEVVKRWGNKNRSRSVEQGDPLVVHRLIDLYHTQTHNEEGLIHEIVAVLDPKQRYFTKYTQKRSALTLAKYERGEIAPIQELRREMFDTFLEELNELGQTHDKVVLVFDTAEVLTYETDRVQAALGLAHQPIGVAGWLIQDLIARLQNAVIVIAGRPEGAHKLLETELKKTDAKLIHYSLSGFTEEETLEYFDVITDATRTENSQNAKRIESIPVETRQEIHRLTQGEPFLLALLIDFLAIANEIPSLEAREPEAFREELWDLIVEAVQEGWRGTDQVVEALSWTPKGMGAKLLAWVLHDRQPTDEDISEAQELINTLREPEKRLSFVKIRAADELVFLQDEMYTLMEKSHMAPAAIQQKKRINNNINAYYEESIHQTHREIFEMESGVQTTGAIASASVSQIIKKWIKPDEKKIRKTLAKLQAYQVEQVYYLLRSNQLKGFELYIQYAEESFQSRDLNLFLLLRDELLQFAEDVRKGKFELENGLTLKAIEADLGTRWIKVSIADEKYEEAGKQITRFREMSSDLLLPGSYADLNLKIWETWILAYTGKDHERAWVLLDEILEKLNSLPSDTSLDRWRISFLKAYAMSMHGFLHRVQGRFDDAVKKYLDAVPLWRELKFELEASNTLNNLAWAEGEAGDFQTALDHCKDGLDMRRRLGKRYLIGLSLNTLGLIETRAGKLGEGEARLHCQQALKIFREMEVRSGIGLASLAYAEALRRVTNTDAIQEQSEATALLKDAGGYAEDAVKIFSDPVKQPLRLIEAYIEAGCVYREWTRYILSTSPEWKEKVEQSRAAYEGAVRMSEEWGYEYRAIDALVNMAWLYYYAGNVEKAQEILKEQVRDRLGDRYLYTTEHGVNPKDVPTSWNWVQLGKANLLLGTIHFDRYQQADGEKKKDEAKERLQQAAHNWTLSMAYNRLYGTSFRDFDKSRKQVYEKMLQLNPTEMEWVKSSMERTHREYHIEKEQRAFEQFLKERFGINV